MNKQIKAKFLLTTILGLPLLGVVVAYTSYHTGLFSEIGRTNNGELILPPIALKKLKLETLIDSTNKQIDSVSEKTWKLLVLGGAKCDDTCQQQLYLTRQVHIALGKEANRLERVYISTDNKQLTNEIYEEHPRLKVANISKKVIDKHLQNKVKAVEDSNMVLLADPLGNIMMYYTQKHSGKAILKDIKHLMKISRIG